MKTTGVPTGHMTEPDQQAEAGLRRRERQRLAQRPAPQFEEVGGKAFETWPVAHMGIPLEFFISGKTSKRPGAPLERSLSRAAREERAS